MGSDVEGSRVHLPLSTHNAHGAPNRPTKSAHRPPSLGRLLQAQQSRKIPRKRNIENHAAFFPFDFEVALILVDCNSSGNSSSTPPGLRLASEGPNLTAGRESVRISGQLQPTAAATGIPPGPAPLLSDAGRPLRRLIRRSRASPVATLVNPDINI